LEVVFVGAERLPDDLADAFSRRFGVRPTEGYGATELSPVVCGNTPEKRPKPGDPTEPKTGTVGRPIPGLEVRVVDLENGQTLSSERQGMLCFRGPTVMKGYLGRPDLTTEVLQEGWYISGDVGSLDRDGFLQITGRVSRFSKIAGEMVPHLRIEQAIGEVLSGEQEDFQVAVVGLPDATRGERLLVFYTHLALPPKEICRRMIKSGIPPLWVPSESCFRQIDALPLLGSGKLDLARLRDLAMEKSAHDSGHAHSLPVDSE
jgi:acyl-[acyl-carrier-protein]-phospholipid O-acyltransferase/long-chain-fatty-acid--[acyl-carrier-protein] ligase